LDDVENMFVTFLVKTKKHVPYIFLRVETKVLQAEPMLT